MRIKKNLEVKLRNVVHETKKPRTQNRDFDPISTHQFEKNAVKVGKLNLQLLNLERTEKFVKQNSPLSS